MRPPFVAHLLKFACGRGPVTALDAAAQRAALCRSTVRFRTSLVAISALVALSACSPIQPWVKPYEREHLADPIMALDRNPVSSTYLDHVLETREGARGATGAVGGGCGCN